MLYLLQQNFGSAKYSRLEALLSSEKWELADKKTSQILLNVSGREWFGEIDDLLGRENSLKEFPCQDLDALDSLWVQYSNNRFGLSVQQTIFQSLEVKDFDGDWFKLYDHFFTTVGWQDVAWRDSKPTFSIHAPKGHLPSPNWMKRAGGSGKTIPWISNGIYIFNRLEVCKSQ